MGDTCDILSLLEEWADSTWGFVIYRCTYSSDEKWAHFMELLYVHSKEWLEGEDLGQIVDSLEWTVRENRMFESASKHELRTSFRDWVGTTSAGKRKVNPRYDYFIVADQECLDSVLDREDPTELEVNGRAYVKLLRHILECLFPLIRVLQPSQAGPIDDSNKMEDEARAVQSWTEVEGFWGFVIHRCTYRDDDEWDLFMAHLNAHAQAELDANNAGHLIKSLRWEVQEDISYQGASKSFIRQRFQGWREKQGRITSPRGDYCIMVDQDSLDSVLVAGIPPDFDSMTEPYVDLIDRRWRQLYVDDTEVIGSEELDPAKPLMDEGCEEVEGCKMENVGWTRVDVSLLSVRLFTILHDVGWEIVYKRPPELSSP
ncbi:hypothetical protein BDZ85DRAFT_280629 [Elsinoe ampelina]|uniref:Uncharacterized protein n=1 Tax=Elsinoe ampelina TaxID=302913 RepID=A0A6A6GF24_9PEZI|nr:hypothetical protein BDZ85DRAFT_280629 [Elsinoe ampelina]